MKIKRRNLFALLCLTMAWGTGGAMAQTDVTDEYLANPYFDNEEYFDYGVSETGNVAQEILDVTGWTKDINVDYTITGTYAVGTGKTFNGASVPATNADGEATGGVLALSTGWDQSLKYYQGVALPAGKYAIATAFYNGCDQTAGSSLVGWVPNSGTATLSTLNSFPVGTWVKDTVWFDVTDAEAEGRIQIGLLAASGGSANSAKVSLDYVKLLYYGMDKSLLQSLIDEATALYGDGTGINSEELKDFINEAQQMVNSSSATDKQLATAMGNLKTAMEEYRLSNASLSNPIDMTDRITNPSFESGTTGWTQEGMQTQTNTAFTPKSGTTYVEKWTQAPGPVADCYVKQTVTGLPNGRYQLKAAAQNLQQNDLNAAQSGAYIHAGEEQTTVTSATDYEVKATVIDGKLTIGFAVTSSTGNWVAVDNFRLYYIGNDATAIREALQALIDEAEALTTQKMHSEQLAALNTAITAAKAELEKEDTGGFAEASTALEEACTAATQSADAYAALNALIEEATALIAGDTSSEAATLAAAIATAQSVYDADNTIEALDEATATLDKAAFALRIAKSTGTAPTVTTGKYVARGSTMAFGRSSVSPATNLLERGFCWSTNPEPTVLDNRSSDYFTNNGYIYHMDGLTPATIYYVRAYAITKDYAVGYGDVVKIITLPKGNISWGYDNGGSDEENERINNAVAEAVDYWNNLTSINGLYLNVHYGASTPTADCSYGGWMRVGPNASYQRTGTILHEAGHAIGVGTHEIWYGSNSPLRAGSGTGVWLGDRATEVVRFLENNTTSTMSGDGTHMWPYGVNGAHEDTGSAILYIGNGLITQALGEDGLPPTGGFCTPAYVFEQEDNVKYYIKNEDPDRGLYSSYLVENAKGNLEWKTLTAAEAKADDACAWYITFTPANCYYQLRNASTGHYVTYSGTGTNGITTATRTAATSSENFHLMRSRVDAVIGQGSDAMTVRGYWIIHPEATLNPACLSASADGVTATATFNLGDAATTQRWVILEADQLEALESAALNAYNTEIDEMIARLTALIETPHTENTEGVDATMTGMIASLEAIKGTGSNTEIAALLEEAETTVFTFIGGATPTDIYRPFDISFLIANADFDGTDGWSTMPTINYSCGEFFSTGFDMNQTIASMPKGTYQVRVNAFQRPGSSADAYSAYVAGTSTVTTFLYATSATPQRISHICDGMQEKSLSTGETTVGSTFYVPYTMQAASNYFAEGLYENALTVNLAEKKDFKFGIRCATYSDNYWVIFDSFRLYSFGSLTAEEVANGIEETMAEPALAPLFAVPTDIYNVMGIRVRTQATSLEGLPAGLYLVGGRKVIVR